MSETLARNADLWEQAAWRDLEGASYSVLGLGKSGVAAANALAARGARVLAVDDAPEHKLTEQLQQLAPGIEVAVGGGPAGRRGDLFVLSPGIGPHSNRFRDVQALASGVVGELELFYRLERGDSGLGVPIAAISGTDGKTTTTLWTGHLLQQAGYQVTVGGNIGDPLCGFLGQFGPSSVVVAEVSAFQLWTCQQFRPRAAVVTNIALDHMDYFHNDLERYVRTKCSVRHKMGPGDWYAVNGDDVELEDERALLRKGVAHAWQVFSTQGIPERGLGFDGERLWWALGGSQRIALCHVSELGADGRFPITGLHNVENALAASSLALAFGVPLAELRAGLRSFGLPSHRIEPVGHIGQVRFFDDSKATNPHAAIAGLRAMTKAPGERVVWIAGGSEKDSDFAELGTVVAELADAAVLIGQTAERIAACLPSGFQVARAAKLEEAVVTALQLCGDQGAVLLSPACASYDMFRSYAHRGDVFAGAVAALGKAMGRFQPPAAATMATPHPH